MRRMDPASILEGGCMGGYVDKMDPLTSTVDIEMLKAKTPCAEQSYILRVAGMQRPDPLSHRSVGPTKCYSAIQL